MSACCCSSRTCELFGCQRDAQDRAQFSPLRFAPNPMNVDPNFLPPAGVTVVQKTLTEEDIRRIIHEELSKITKGSK